MGWEKLLKCHMKGKASKKLANGQNIDYSEKRKRPKGFICPCTGVKYHNIQTCLLVYAADSGERLQDHWSSGFQTMHHFLVTCFHIRKMGARPGYGPFESFSHYNDILVIINDYFLELGVCYVPLHHSFIRDYL